MVWVACPLVRPCVGQKKTLTNHKIPSPTYQKMSNNHGVDHIVWTTQRLLYNRFLLAYWEEKIYPRNSKSFRASVHGFFFNAVDALIREILYRTPAESLVRRHASSSTISSTTRFSSTNTCVASHGSLQWTHVVYVVDWHRIPSQGISTWSSLGSLNGSLLLITSGSATTLISLGKITRSWCFQLDTMVKQ